MVKVCHIISGYFRIDARVFQRQCKSLKNNGFEVSVLTNDGEPEEVIDGIPFYSCKKVYDSRIKTFFFASKQFYEKAKIVDADIYQLHSPELLPLGMKLKRLGKKVVYDAHEHMPMHILEKDWIPKPFRIIISKFVKLYMEFILPRFDFTITPHSHVLSDLKNKVKNIELIANFPLFNESSNLSFEEYSNRNNRICYTGTVYPYSNQQLLANAVQSINDLKYDIAGHIDNELLKELESIIPPSKFKFHGRLAFNQLPEFYNNSTIGYVVYDYKLNLGHKLGSYGTNKIFEYMEAGLPIICTDYILWKEIIDKYDCGICVEPNNYKQIENAIKLLISNKEKAYEMGQNGIKAILNEFNWVSQEKLYLGIFKKYNQS